MVTEGAAGEGEQHGELAGNGAGFQIELLHSARVRAFTCPESSVEEGFTILDFGGSDGKFVPRLEAQKYVFEISKVEPVPGVTRVHSAAELGTYSLVQLPTSLSTGSSRWGWSSMWLRTWLKAGSFTWKRHKSFVNEAMFRSYGYRVVSDTVRTLTTWAWPEP